MPNEIVATNVRGSEEFFLTLIPDDGGESVVIRTAAKFTEVYLTRADEVLYAIDFDGQQISHYEALRLLREFEKPQVVRPRQNWEDLYHECPDSQYRFGCSCFR